MRDVPTYAKGKSLKQLAEEITRYLNIKDIHGYLSSPGSIDWTSTSENLLTTGSGTFGDLTADSLTVDNININVAAITSDTGSVGFGDDNLVTTGYFQTTCAAAATNAILISVTGDTNKRFDVNADGEINWGPGNAALDTNLYRNAANELQTDDSFTAIGTITGGNITINAASISSTTGAITFLNENLTTTGNISCGAALSLVMSSGSITDTTGAISFGNENLTTTGLITTGNLDIDTLNLNGNVITDSTGTISFGNEILTTTGSVTAGTLTIQGGAITDSTGAITFLNEDLSTTGNITASNFITGGNVDGVDVSALELIQIIAGNGLTGGGTLQADRTLTVAYGAEPPAVANSTSGTAGTNLSASHSDHGHDLAAHSHIATEGGALSASVITTGLLAHERGGLEADISAYAGLIKITAPGTTSNIAITAGGEARVTNASNYGVTRVFTDNILNVHTITILNSLITNWVVA